MEARRGASMRGDVVVDFRIGVEGEPIADEGQAVGEVECAEAGAGISGAVFDVRLGRTG